MLTVTPSSYARFSAALIAETLVEKRRHELEAILARYLQFHGMTADYQLREDWLWGAAEIATFVGVSPRRIFGWVENGRFPHVKMGNGGIAARRTIVLAYVFAQELASIKGISLKAYAVPAALAPPVKPNREVPSPPLAET